MAQTFALLGPLLMIQGLPGFLVGLLLMAALLAGCLGGDDALDGSADDDAGSGPAEVSEDTGAISGAVSSELFEPLNGARAELLTMDREPTDHSSTTDSDGEFTISHVEPGDYILFVTRVNFEASQRGVSVTAGEITDVRFQLTELERTGPWIEEFDRAGDVNTAASWQLEIPTQGCIVGPVIPGLGWEAKNCGGIRSGGNAGETRVGPTSNVEGWENSVSSSDFRETDLSDMTAIVLEMAWTPAGPFGEHFQVDLMCSDMPRGGGGGILEDEHDCYKVQRGESPIQLRFDEEEWLDRGFNHTGTWAARVFASYGILGTYDLTGIDAGLAYQQTFEKYWTVFHGEPAPEGYSRLPDA